MRPYTASEAERVDACPASAALPRVLRDSADAARGTVLHAFLAEVPAGRDAALERVPEEHRAACEAIDLERLPVTRDYAAEVALAYDTETGEGRELGRMLGRAYPTTKPTELCGTADVVGLVGTSGVVIMDYKTGRSKRTPAAKSWQLRILALAACRAYHRSEATIAVVRIFDDGSSWFDVAQLDAWALDDVVYDLEALDKRVDAAVAQVAAWRVPDVAIGDHCRWCPCMAACPGRAAMVRQALEPQTLAPIDALRALSPAELAAAVPRIATLKSIAIGLDTAIKELAAAHPIDLGDGKVYGLARGKEYLDADVVERVAADMLPGQSVVSVIVKKHATKSAVEAAVRTSLGEKPPRGAIKATKERVLGAIEASGGTRRGSAFVRVCKPEDVVKDSPGPAPTLTDEELEQLPF